MLNLVLICGGPSKECNISLNSARSVFDHMRTMPDIYVQIIFISENHEKYIIDEKFLYSNTTSDFKFMLGAHGKCIDDTSFLNFLKKQDIVFPVMHGKYGEDGELQKFLEKNNIPFIASPSKSCNLMYNKYNADEKILKANNMVTIPKLFLKKEKNLPLKIKNFLSKNNLNEVILKPVEGGSSIGVLKAEGIEEITEKALNLLDEYDFIVAEKLCHGREFTIIILEKDNNPVALIPTEIEILDKDGKPVSGKIFDQRKKYMPTTETHYYCPARFDDNIINKIRGDAEFLFSAAGAKDFLRIDGWLLDDGSVYFSDFNPISGMEQNSFIFQQASRIGFTHSDLLEYILRNACNKYGIEFNPVPFDNANKKRVNILLGGTTSERQVSVLSGVNTWLKLLNSKKYYPVPYILLSENGEYYVHEIPYAVALNHTTEEIYDQILHSGFSDFTNKLKDNIISELKAENITRCKKIDLERKSLFEFFKQTKEQCADIFICLHGGFGENGTLQKLLEQNGIHFNGSGSIASGLCINKYATGEKINSLGLSNLRSCKKKKISLEQIKKFFEYSKSEWKSLCEYFESEKIVVKPNDDGCSTGIVILRNEFDLKIYSVLCSSDASFIPENTFINQPNKIQLPKEHKEFLFEEYIETQKLEVRNDSVINTTETNWIELTIGVLEKQGVYHALNPSITVADNDVLGVEEKFQGGTGINITPPPLNIINADFINLIKTRMETVAKECGIKDYCRIDLFANNETNEIIVIEINSLPGLSPSTVLFQQGAKEEPPLYPTELLEYIISVR